MDTEALKDRERERDLGDSNIQRVVHRVDGARDIREFLDIFFKVKERELEA